MAIRTGQSARVGPFLLMTHSPRPLPLQKMGGSVVSPQADQGGCAVQAKASCGHMPYVSRGQNRSQSVILGSFLAKKPASYSVVCPDYRVALPMNASPQRISFFKPRPENRCVYCNATSYGHPLTEIEANEEAITRES